LGDAEPDTARERFAALLAPVIGLVRDRALDDALQAPGRAPEWTQEA
jgi:hypothetical protein